MSRYAHIHQAYTYIWMNMSFEGNVKIFMNEIMNYVNIYINYLLNYLYTYLLKFIPIQIKYFYKKRLMILYYYFNYCLQLFIYIIIHS